MSWYKRTLIEGSQNQMGWAARNGTPPIPWSTQREWSIFKHLSSVESFVEWQQELLNMSSIKIVRLENTKLDIQLKDFCEKEAKKISKIYERPLEHIKLSDFQEFFNFYDILIDATLYEMLRKKYQNLNWPVSSKNLNLLIKSELAQFREKYKQRLVGIKYNVDHSSFVDYFTCVVCPKPYYVKVGVDKYFAYRAANPLEYYKGWITEPVGPASNLVFMVGGPLNEALRQNGTRKVYCSTSKFCRLFEQELAGFKKNYAGFKKSGNTDFFEYLVEFFETGCGTVQGGVSNFHNWVPQ